MGNSVHLWGQYFRMLPSVKAMVTAPLRELLYLMLSVWRSHGMRRFSLPNPSRHQRCHCWECWEAIARIQGKSNQVWWHFGRRRRTRTALRDWSFCGILLPWQPSSVCLSDVFLVATNGYAERKRRLLISGSVLETMWLFGIMKYLLSTVSRYVSFFLAFVEKHLEHVFQEIFKVKGFQVTPAELEGHLLLHPDVIDSCVVSIPDDYSGELPLAYIVLRPHAAARIESNPKVTQQLKQVIFKVSEVGHFCYRKFWDLGLACSWFKGPIQMVDWWDWIHWFHTKEPIRQDCTW